MSTSGMRTSKSSSFKASIPPLVLNVLRLSKDKVDRGYAEWMNEPEGVTGVDNEMTKTIGRYGIFWLGAEEIWNQNN